MFKNLSERLFPFLIALTALSVSASAAFYSVSGLSKLFAGASLAVIIMAGSLEVAKLVIASLLYQYRNTIPKLLKYYLTIACIVLVLITSMGIYGFLSAAYQETANKEGNRDAQITLIKTKRDNVQSQLEVYIEEKSNINEAVTELRKGLSNNKVQWRDKETGQIITSTSSKTRKVLQTQLNDFKTQRNKVSLKIESLTDSITKLDLQVLDLQSNSEVANEIGPLKYVSELLDRPMNQVVNWFILIFIFVFDPLAVVLLIAANKAFDIVRPIIKENIYGEQVIKNSNPDAFRPPHPSDAAQWNEEKIEKRMDIIGQNGNEGLHYEEENKNPPPIPGKTKVIS